MNQILLSPTVDMPLGKKIAQISHAAVNLLIERFQMINGELITTDLEVISWINDWARAGYRVEISTLDQHSLDSGYYESNGVASRIIDLGRTVFNGQPTLTAIGYSPLKLPTYAHNYIEPNFDDEVRQVFLINEQSSFFQSKGIESAMASLSVASIMKNAIFSENSITIKTTDEILEWISGGHAKIVLKSKTSGQIEKLSKELDSNHEVQFIIAIDEEHGTYGIILGPNRRSKTDNLTKRFRLF